MVNRRRVYNEPWLSIRAEIHLLFSKFILDMYGQYLYGVRLIFAESENCFTLGHTTDWSKSIFSGILKVTITDSES